MHVKQKIKMIPEVVINNILLHYVLHNFKMFRTFNVDWRSRTMITVDIRVDN